MQPMYQCCAPRKKNAGKRLNQAGDFAGTPDDRAAIQQRPSSHSIGENESSREGGEEIPVEVCGIAPGE